MTFNAPGVGGIGAEILDLVGIIPGSVPAGNVINVIADPGWSVTAGLGMLLGDISNVFIEDSGLIAGNLMVENHSIAKLTDTLAVYNLFATAASGLDSTEGLNTITAILQTSSSKADHTLESAVTALGELFVTGFTPRTGNEYDTERDHLYTDIDAISSVLENTSGLSIEAFATTDTAGNVTPFSPYAIENNARTDIAYRYALANLNPFAVVGADYTNFNQNGELDLYDPATGQGLTNMYLADRADMLANLIYCNIHDSTDAGGDGSPILYTNIRVDEENLSIYAGKHQTLFDRAYYTFGSEKVDTLTGTSNADHLYGMVENDTLLCGVLSAEIIMNEAA